MAPNEPRNSSPGLVDDFVSRYPSRVLDALLRDRTTGLNIVWASGEHESLGDGYGPDDQVTVQRVCGARSGVVRPRIAKAREHQSLRTRARAEVFTPSWLANRMNNDLDDVWFRTSGTFNEQDGTTWRTNAQPVAFPRRKGHGWHAYVTSPRLEITCGEAPFVCSRYDTVTGDGLPVADRIGFLDRKLRVVGEKTRTRREWVRWALESLKVTYGFEYQGDNLLIARINVFETFAEHLRERWGTDMSPDEMDQVADVVSWNFWQMDGLTCAVPTSRPDAAVRSALPGSEETAPEATQLALFDLPADQCAPGAAENASDEEPVQTVPLCVIFDWQENEPVEFRALKGKARPMDKKFYAVIGNPPYQEEAEGNQRNPPIYNLFMDEAYKISHKVELITPARFLSDAGQTPKDWNRKMLHDPHLKVMSFEPDASTVFSGVDIKGGVAITYRDEDANFGEIRTFVPFDPMRTVLSKVQAATVADLSSIITGAVPYKFSDQAKLDHPDYIALMGKSCDLRTNSLDNLYGKLFFQNKSDCSDGVSIFGLFNRRRARLWIERRYLDVPDNFSSYKVLLPKAIGTGAYGERLPPLEVMPGEVGHTQSFVSMGCFSVESDAHNLVSYLKTKFTRSLLGILKVTQDISPRVWRLVPLQDFTASSDIDWSRPIPAIDQQLYAKYGLSEQEVDFIESHVKEMD